MTLSVGNEYLLKLKHWKHYQLAEVLYISQKYVIVDMRFDETRKAKEFCINLEETEHEFKNK